MRAIKYIKRLVPNVVKLYAIRYLNNRRRCKLKRNRIDTNLPFNEIKKRNCHVFFGYYDITPFNKKDEFVYLNFYPNKKYADIILSNQSYAQRFVTRTRACNWQQGCRLRWLPSDDKKIVFNDFVDGKFVSRIIDIKTKKEKQIDWPLYDISPDCTTAITLDFTRLGYKRPGYGYTNLPFKPELDVRSDGVMIINIKENILIKTITYNEMAKVLGKSLQNKDNWYLNHLAFSPDGTKFIFFFLEDLSKEEATWNANLLLFDMRKNIIEVLDSDYCPSHYVWLDDNRLLCTATNKADECGYYIYDTLTHTRQQVCAESLNMDGHPSVFANNMIITDTYPDNNSFQTIYNVDLEKDSKSKICAVFNYRMRTPEQRTDLHPRFNDDKSIICFDANTNGKRELVLLKIK